MDKPYPSDQQLEDALEAGKSLSGTPLGGRIVHITLVITDGKGAGSSDRFSADLADREAVDATLADIAAKINAASGD